ncbi:unnamed protein product [Clonostachys byssicola]|uniref:DUF7136 domain-containing protein n=1 Tax=Clonostachys byssicola TaxID=160290 RepID=A0A9N9Y5S7_9HYPO|nr:unnamed protein product [Clonostachys byssicola]
MQLSSKLLSAVWLVTAAVSSLGQAQATTSATTTSAATASTPATSTGVPNTFEIDVIYPRNETYNATDTFPVVVAIQRPLVASQMGKFRFGTYIMPYSRGDNPGGIDVGDTMNWIRPYNATVFTDDPFFVIENTDATRWREGVDYDGRGLHALIWSMSWYPDLEECKQKKYYVSGRIFFTIDDEGVNPNILDAAECPFEGSVVQVNNNTESCPAFTVLGKGTGNPCAIKIDAAKATSISSQIASLATPAPAATTTATKDDKDSAAGSLGISIALAQAVVLVSASLLWM